MIDSFSPKNEDIIIKYWPRFAAIESERARKRWGFGQTTKVTREGGTKPKEIPTDVAANILRLKKRGLSNLAIQRSTGQSVYVIQKVAANAGLGRMTRGLMPTKARAIADLIDDGLDNAEIAIALGMPEKTVAAYVDEYNLRWTGP